MIQLKTIREAKGLNMKETANLLGMPYTTYVNYEKGMREPTSEILIQLADFFAVSVDYLVGRDCNSAIHLHSHSASASVSSTSSQIDLTKDEIIMVNKFRCLDDRGKSAVLNVLNHEYESRPGQTTCSSAKEA